MEEMANVLWRSLLCEIALARKSEAQWMGTTIENLHSDRTEHLKLF